MASERPVEDLLFINKKGKPVSPETVRSVLEAGLKRAGLPYLNIHGLRHTFKTLCVERVEDWIVEKYLGHAQNGVSWVYNHAEKPSCRASATMSEIMNPPEPQPAVIPNNDLKDRLVS